MKELLKKLVQAESTVEKGELAAAEIISDHFARSGIDSAVTTWDQNRANITAQIESSGQRNGLLFACHLDVVPPGKQSWTDPPFAGVEKEGKIYGRGSADMKGGIAAVVTAITETVESGVRLCGDIVFFAAAGEETDSCGAKRFVRKCDAALGPPAGVVIPEPTDFEIVTAHRGLLWLKVTTTGKTAHGSTPQLGINAISSMRVLLDELENYEITVEPHNLLGDCSMSINTIEGGEAINVVPDRCTIAIDIRTLPGRNHQEILNDLEKIFEKLKQENPQFKAEVSIVRAVDALQTDNTRDFVKDFCSVVGDKKTKAVGFTTDGPYFAELGAPVVIFGPGKPNLCHKPNEYIELTDVERAVEHYKNIILRFLA
jgi:succinyl-diaminopimelate desuccinylase